MLAWSGSVDSCKWKENCQLDNFLYSVLNPKNLLLIESRRASGVFTTHLKFPKATNVIAAFEADGLQPFINADFDTGQTRASGSNHGHSSHHS